MCSVAGVSFTQPMDVDLYGSLFNSKKLYKALCRTKALVHGVVHTNGQGIPPSIIQKEEKSISCIEQLHGTTIASRLFHHAACPNLLAASVQDTKPVHILSTAAECAEWIVKEKEVWSDRIQKNAMMKYR